MKSRIQNEEERLRNSLTIRFNDKEHKNICDIAWKSRVSASQMIRDIILEKLNENGGMN